MTVFDLILPWLAFGATLFMLEWLQHWIHQHIFGVGYLIGREKGIASLIYYLVLLPGVFMHETSRYLVAGMFGIAPTYVTLSPDTKEDGTFEIGFVHFGEMFNPFHGAVVGIAPLIVGMACVAIIGGKILDLQPVIASFGSGDINVIGNALGKLFSRPDFLLWLWILFGISNAMIPGPEDRRGWWVLGAIFVGFILLLVLVGLYVSVINLLAGPVTNTLLSLSSIFSMVIVLDAIAAGFILIIEFLLSRATNRKIEYRPALPAVLKKERGPVSINHLQLPLPAPPKAGQSARLAPKPAAKAALPASTNSAPPAASPALPQAPRPSPAYGPSSAPAASTSGSGVGGNAPSGSSAGPASPLRPAASTTGTGSPGTNIPGTPNRPGTPATPRSPSTGSSAPGTPSNTPTATPSPLRPAASTAGPGTNASGSSAPGLANRPGTPSGAPGSGSSAPSPFRSPGSPPATGTGSSAPATPGSSTGASPLRPASPPISPGSPATPARSPFGSPSGSPTNPQSGSPSGAQQGSPSSGAGAARSPFSSPPNPARPATPGSGSTSGSGQGSGTGTISGPPALSPRPVPGPAKPVSPAPGSLDPNRSGPPGRPNIGPPQSPLSAPKKPFDVGKDDVIDADVIEDDGELKYEDLDDL